MVSRQLKRSTQKTTEKAPRKRDREQTQKDLTSALQHMQEAGKKISITSVADQAQVSSQLIHMRYPDFAEKIRQITGKGTRDQRDQKQALLQDEREKNRNLREQVKSQLKEITQLASINEALRQENRLLKGLAGKNVHIGNFRESDGRKK